MKVDDPYNKKQSLYPEQELESADDDSWQVSYLDIITIILGFLIILLSVSSLKEIETFSVSDLFKSSENETEFITTPIEQIKERLEALLAQEIADGQLEIYRELNDVKIRFRSDDLYQSGSAEIQPEASALLNRVLAAFKLIEYDDFEIDVEGHTDNVPITTAAYPSNWELSTARASNVVKYFNESGIKDDRLKASGYASSRPVVEFDDRGNPVAASKSKNRRIVLRLFYSNPDQMLADQTEAVEEITEEPIETPENEQILPENSRETEAEEEPQNNEPIAQIENSASPEVVEEETPESVNEVQESQPETIKSNTSTPSTPPSSGNEDNIQGCRYSVQVGSYESFANSIRVANRTENQTSRSFEIVYNNFLFSVRSNAFNSLTRAYRFNDQFSDANDSEEPSAVIYQCYQQDYQYPNSLNYVIQLGFFQNEQNALNFQQTLANEYGIDAKIESLSVQAYTVFAGPYSDRKEAQQKISEFRQNDILSNVFLKYDPKTVSDYSYDYQIIAGSYRSKTRAFQISQSLQDLLNISSEVITKEDGNSYVITQSQNNWDDTLIRLEQLAGSNLNLTPVIYLTERS